MLVSRRGFCGTYPTLPLYFFLGGGGFIFIGNFNSNTNSNPNSKSNSKIQLEVQLEVQLELELESKLDDTLLPKSKVTSPEFSGRRD